VGISACPEVQVEIMTYARTWAVEDMVIRSGGDGRTVEAYAAVFGIDTEVKDQHGHYIENIDRSAFNRALPNDRNTAMCLYNHGYTVHGQSSALGSVPIGKPLEIRADQRGLFTVTRYNKSELASATLESIKNGDITAQSFRGKIYKSTPDRVPMGRGGELPRITRTALGLTDYGPTPAAIYREAEIMAVRSGEALAMLLHGLTPEERAELIRTLASTAPSTDTETPPPAPSGPGTEDLDAARSARDVLSGRLEIQRALNRLRAIDQGVFNGTST
jgi:HK97 family phage prohead protease